MTRVIAAPSAAIRQRPAAARSALALHVRVERFQIWNAALAVGIATGFAVSLAWLAAAGDAWPGFRIGVGLFSVGGLLAAATGWRRAPFDLAWDGAGWSVSADSSVSASSAVSLVSAGRPAAVTAWRGELVVAVDFGNWLLLRFTPAPADRRCILRWLPLQRRGLELQWHALRATVYSARSPATDTTATADEQGPA